MIPPLHSGDHFLGSEDAPVTLVEYGDFQCPSCGRAYPIVSRILKALNGSLLFAFRNFPMNRIHPDALGAATAAEAAGLQGRFWQMHNLLFENQDYLDPESLLRYAAGLRLDTQKFARDFRRRQAERTVQTDFESGLRSGVNGTPTFFINGVRFDGDWSYPSLLLELQSVAESVRL